MKNWWTQLQCKNRLQPGHIQHIFLVNGAVRCWVKVTEQYVTKSDHTAAEGPTQTADVQRKTELSRHMTQITKSLTKSTDMKKDVVCRKH